MSKNLGHNWSNNLLRVVCNTKDLAIHGIIDNVNSDINCKSIINCMTCNEFGENYIGQNREKISLPREFVHFKSNFYIA